MTMNAVHSCSSAGSWRWTRRTWCILPWRWYQPNTRLHGVANTEDQNINYEYFVIGLTYFSVALRPNWGLGRHILEVSRSHTIRHTHARMHAHSKTPRNEWSARRRSSYLHNKHIGGIRTRDALDRTATGICNKRMCFSKFYFIF
jgi:hypothetical protein